MNSLDMNPDSGDKTTPDDEDHTVMVDRVATPQDSTPDDEDHTIVVGRTSNGAAKPQPDKPQPDKPQSERLGRAARRRGLTPPPVPAGFAPQAVEAVGPDATESYRPRAIPDVPPPAPVIAQGPDATREASATMPSVARHARIMARVAVVVFVVSCVASIVGLTLIALSRL